MLFAADQYHEVSSGLIEERPECLEFRAVNIWPFDCATTLISHGCRRSTRVIGLPRATRVQIRRRHYFRRLRLWTGRSFLGYNLRHRPDFSIDSDFWGSVEFRSVASANFHYGGSKSEIVLQPCYLRLFSTARVPQVSPITNPDVSQHFARWWPWTGSIFSQAGYLADVTCP